jgi:GDP-6-deoxy-D-talose 4-dehydrogenase
MNKVLLTGASGFIGKYLLEQLVSDGYKVVSFANKHVRDGFVNCDLQDAEITSRLVLETNPDIIVHAAALSSVTKGSTIDYYNLNVLASENLFKAVEKLHGRKRIVFLSTAGVYGNQEVECLTEDLNPKPVSHYGLSKFVCERLLYNMANAHDITILRPFNVIGYGQADSFVVPKLIKHFAVKADSITLGNVHTRRDYISVELCARLISKIIPQQKSFGEVVNLCSGYATSVTDIINILSRLTGHKIKILSSAEFIRSNEIFTLIGSADKLNSMVSSNVTADSLDSSLHTMLQAHLGKITNPN